MSETFFPGKEAWYASDTPTAKFTAIFEDDGDTGYLYANDRADGNRVLDAVHIYNVSSVASRNRESFVEIVWTRDGLKAALFINGCPHAVIDFAGRRSYCRSGFPAPPRDWNREVWSEELMELFRRR
jgi:hypothetical protein